MAVVCPGCGKDDRIAKFSAISRSERGVAPYYDANHGGHSTQGAMSHLASVIRRARPPDDPPQQGTRGCLWIILSGFPFLCFVFLGLAFSMPGEPRAAVYLMLSVVAFVVAVGLAGSGLYQMSPVGRRKRKDRNARMRQSWQDASAKFQRSYCCYGCGVAFDPDTGEHCEIGSSERLKEFVYSTAPD